MEYPEIEIKASPQVSSKGIQTVPALARDYRRFLACIEHLPSESPKLRFEGSQKQYSRVAHDLVVFSIFKHIKGIPNL